MDEYKHIMTEVASVSSIIDAKSNQLTFCDKIGQKAVDLINNSKAGVIICSNKLNRKALNYTSERALIFSNNPRLDFIKICDIYFPEEINLIDSSIVSSTAIIGNNVSIGSKNVRIGDNTVIHNNVMIYDNVHIGKTCLIKSGAVIGGDGFGYEQDIDGTWFKFPHYGRVTIGDNVHIGSNACIDRGNLSDTIIEDGVKIDNLVHVAHNVHIGKNSLVIALAILGGHSKFGENVWIAPASCVRDGVEVSNNSMVGLGAVVVKDVSENTVVIGNPAKFYKKRCEIE